MPNIQIPSHASAAPVHVGIHEPHGKGDLTGMAIVCKAFCDRRIPVTDHNALNVLGFFIDKLAPAPMDVKDAIALAERYAPRAAPRSSAYLNIERAVDAFVQGDEEAAFRYTLRSLTYSIGMYHEDYYAVKAAMAANGVRA